MAQKNLVVVRCGDQSLHEAWLAEDANFDVVLSYYGKTDKYHGSAVKAIHPFQGSKWEGLHDFFSNHAEVWQEYDAIWIPDDDIATSVDNINQFFALFHQHGFDLAQPALTHNSYFSWGICLQNTEFVYRLTDFVEVMVPCFSRQAMQLLAPSFAANKSGWGMEFLWVKLLGQQGKVGIVDATPVHHTRPVSSAGNGMGAGQHGLTPHQEMVLLMQTHQLAHQSNVFAGLNTAGTLLPANTAQFTKTLLSGSAAVLFEAVNVHIKRYFYVENRQ